MRTLESLGDLRSQTVLIRCDLNVPLSDGEITDDGRIRAALTTIRELREAGARVVAMSHLGRPDGGVVDALSLRPVAKRMSELLDAPVSFCSESIGAEAAAAKSRLSDGDVLLLENLRFHAAETSKNADERRAFAAGLAEGTSAFVSDGFGVVHRDQASVTTITEFLPSAAGRLVQAELEILQRLTTQLQRPYTVVLGGSKVSDKLGVIQELIERVDTLLVGGGMLFTFLAAQGHAIGKSLVERDQIETVRGYLERARDRGVQVVLPSDIVVSTAVEAGAETQVVDAERIEESAFGADAIGLDIGPASARTFDEAIRASETVFWNGPMGVFEIPEFAAGTRSLAQSLTETSAFTVVGGGDSAAAVRLLGFADEQFGHISTGGGASLEFLEGKTLPGLEVLA